MSSNKYRLEVHDKGNCILRVGTGSSSAMTTNHILFDLIWKTLFQVQVNTILKKRVWGYDFTHVTGPE